MDVSIADAGLSRPVGRSAVSGPLPFWLASTVIGLNHGMRGGEWKFPESG
ncbi:MAG TPA: hypothetical protein VI306_13310 [Pyrinomonadaceae bacterium]